MEKFKLALGIHNHQPVGNFDSVFEEAHNKAYRPFLELFDKFENLSLSLHQSGILWAWQEMKYPAYFDLVQRLIYDDRLELMTGGFYEPILPAIPDCDKIGQIQMLNRYLAGKFGEDPTGLWLTERVWEPHLPKILKAAEVEYVPIDDTHFLYAGFEPEQLTGVFITEEAGKTIKLLPIQKKLRYLIPFGSVNDVIGELKKQAEKNPGGLAIYADDGEKFGIWPKTHQHCYTDRWLENFFRAVSDNSDWLEICTLGQAAMTPPVGRAYLPTASYAEMLHWSLPPKAFVEYEEFERWLKDMDKFEQYGRFVRGGHWRGFLAKYEEANLMHKRMLLVSDKLNDYIKRNPNKRDVYDQAKHHLYGAQCNCPYWHGVFGGLYLPHIRSAVFQNLITVENMITPGMNQIKKSSFDFDADGHKEIIIETNKFTAVMKPSRGGALVELDNREASFNVTDTLRRYREGYHAKLHKAATEDEPADNKTASIHDLILSKEKNLDKHLHEDWYLRRCFIDHFLSENTGPEEFATGKFGEDGDFVLEGYDYDWKSDDAIVKLTRRGKLWRKDDCYRLQVDKNYYFDLNSEVVGVGYCFTAEDKNITNVRFALENNFNFLAGHSDDRYILFDGQRAENSFLDSTNTRPDTRSVIIRDDWADISIALSWDKMAEIWQTPIFTVSLSEGGFEKVYQGTSIVKLFNFDLEKGKPYEIAVMLFCGRPENMPPRFLKKSPQPETISGSK